MGLAVPHVAIVPIKTSSPERRTTTSQKEIVAGEERPKYLAIKQLENQGMVIVNVVYVEYSFSSILIARL